VKVDVSNVIWMISTKLQWIDMIFRQHVPGYIDGTPREVEISSSQELLDLEWVKSYAEDFTSFTWCQSDHRLMIDGISKRTGNRVWWVVGHLPKGVNWFPEWSITDEEIERFRKERESRRKQEG
jgi:hypothetical protein